MKTLQFLLLSILVALTTLKVVGNNPKFVPINNSTNPEKPISTVISSNPKQVLFQFAINGFFTKLVQTPQGIQNVISLERGTPILKTGAPDLEKLTTSIIIPNTANTKIEIIDAKYIDYFNIIVAPSKGNLTRNQNPAQVPFTYDAVYQKNQFFPTQIAYLRDPYIMRDYRGQTVVFQPLQYNPVTKTLRVYYNVTLAVNTVSGKAINALTSSNLSHTSNSTFNALYQRHFINYNPTNQKYNTIDESGTMLIITPQQFAAQLLPLAQWKNQRGLPTQIVTLESIGGTTAEIKNFIDNQYFNGKLTYLLLVGDAELLPSNWSDVAYGDSDVMYGFIQGNDHYPEIFVGRFSAETEKDVQTQVQRTIAYEKYPDLQGNWFKNAAFIGSAEGPGDDNEMDWEHERNMRQDCLNFTYTKGYEFYDGDQGEEDEVGNPTSDMLAAAVNNGVSLILYTGHGSDGSCVTTDFNINDVKALTNTQKLPFFISVACVNGNFVGQTCFAETWLRETDNNNNPTGAIGTLMSTVNQSWNPPMEGQDEMIDILTQQYPNQIMYSFGAICYNGCMKMNDSYGEGGDAMTDTWTLFGDPSVWMRTNTPVPITASIPNTLPLGSSQVQISNTIPGVLVTASINGNTIATTVANDAGIATLNFNPISSLDSLNITIIGFNAAPFLGSIQIVPNQGPFIIQSQQNVSDNLGNNNNLADYTETITLNTTLKNLGNANANNTTAILVCNDPYITLIDDNQYFGNISNNAEVVQNNAFSLKIANNIPDQYLVNTQLQISDNENNNWTSFGQIKINAPKLNQEPISIFDTGNMNNQLDPGESIAILAPIKNIGHSNAHQGVSKISSPSPYITITYQSYNFNAIETNGVENANFSLIVSPNTPLGTLIPFHIESKAGDYTATLDFTLTAGLIVENFESGDFLTFDWQNTTNQPWIIDTEVAFDGGFSSKSGQIADNFKSDIVIQQNVAQEGEIAFYKKVSCEQDYDFLIFYIDGIKIAEWTGEVDWSREAFTVTPGIHTFKWSYKKDDFMASGADAAWIDFVTFPPNGTIQCVSDAGTIATQNNPTINENTFTIEIINANYLNDDEHTQAFIYINNLTNKIEGIANSTTLTLPLGGDYQIYALNYLSNNPPNIPIGSILDAISGDCYDLSNVLEINYVSLQNQSVISQNHQINIQPIPATNILNISLNTTQQTSLNVKIINVEGKVLQTLNYNNLLPGKNTILLNVEELTSGLYILQLQDNKQTKSIKFVKQ